MKVIWSKGEKKLVVKGGRGIHAGVGGGAEREKEETYEGQRWQGGGPRGRGSDAVRKKREKKGVRDSGGGYLALPGEGWRSQSLG